MKKFLAIFFTILLLAGIAQARPIIANLSIRSIHIDTNFRGIEILLFGAREDPGNIVVVVRGPSKNYTVRKKERVAGMWVNTEQRDFENISSFYAIASSRQMEKIDNEALLKSLKIGYSNQDWKSDVDGKLKQEAEFNAALLDNLQKHKLYPLKIEKVSFWGETLFQTNLKFPSSLPEGKYSVEVYLFSDGELAAQQTMPLYVKKVGFEAFVHNIAIKHPALYGIVAVLMALVTGWVASIVFRKV